MHAISSQFSTVKIFACTLAGSKQVMSAYLLDKVVCVKCIWLQYNQEDEKVKRHQIDSENKSLIIMYCV